MGTAARQAAIGAPAADVLERAPVDAEANAASWMWTSVAAVTLFAVPLLIGSVIAFPLFDDGWLALLIKESGAAAVAATVPDRPLYGAMMQLVAAVERPWRVWSALNIVSWVVLALQTAGLWRRVAPESKRLAPLVASLVIAPLVIQTQLITVTMTLYANVSAIAGYAALLVLLRYVESGHAAARPIVALTIAGSAIGISVIVSEYGVAVAAAGIALLAGLYLWRKDAGPRSRAVTAMVVAGVSTALSYGAFLRLGSFENRPSVSPGHALSVIAGDLPKIPFAILSGVWRASVGAYATAIGSVAPTWSSRATVAALVFGMAAAAILVRLCESFRGSETFARHDHFLKRSAIVMAAIAVGLTPVAIMGRPPAGSGFASRFAIPILPLAVVATTLLAGGVVRPRYRWLPVALMGFIAGYATVATLAAEAARQGVLARVGDALAARARSSPGYTVAVVAMHGEDYELTAKATSTWPPDVARRTWIVDDERGVETFGGRGNCQLPSHFERTIRGWTRRGALDELLWIDLRNGQVAAIEPYCAQRPETGK